MYIYIVFLYIKGEFFLFNDLLGLKLNKRTAVRAIIFNENKLLMVKSNLGDYKLPGGGVEKGESHEEAIKREDPGFICTPLISKKRVQDIETEVLLKTLFEGSFSKLIHEYAMNNGLSKVERMELLRVANDKMYMR